MFNTLISGIKSRLFNKLPMIYQTENSTCGLACISMVLGYFGKKVTITAMQDTYPVSLKGITLKQVISIANKYSLVTRAVRCDVDSLKSIIKPAILHWDFHHFVVLKSVKRNTYIVHDPDLGVLSLTRQEFQKHFTGIVLEVSPETEFSLSAEGKTLGLNWIYKNTKGMRKLLMHTVWLTLILEVIALISPLFIKYSVDYGIDRLDSDFIIVFSFAFIAIVILHAILSFLRSYISIYLGATFNKQFIKKLVSHMLSLPISFFEKRNTGDLIEKYQSSEHIRNLLTSNVVNILLDGAISIAMSIAIFFISPILGSISLASFLLYFLFRFKCSNQTELKMKEYIKAKAHETGFVIETLRCISPIKTFAKEEERVNIWLGRYLKLMQTEVNLSLYINFQKSIQILVFGIDITLSIYFGAQLVMAETLTLGTLFAFFMYKSQFSMKAASLTNSLIDLKYFTVYLDRLSDIVLSEPENHQDRIIPKETVTGKIELKNVSFSYAVADDLIFNNINVTIEKGEFIAIIGNSGSGKTTLLKIILGLYQPNNGTVLIDDYPINTLNMEWYRRQFGVVMQEDQLISASIVDNISFQDPWADFPKVQEAAKQSNVHDEIMSMPMQYNTTIGDLGSSLSGGQKQRILLARALYHKPQVIFTDEGTANLDSKNEISVLNEISSLPLTRICIAHRPQTLLRADRVLLLDKGQLIEISKKEALARSKEYGISNEALSTVA
jgi:ATP-binding cassette subfamily B protein RaxB